MTPERLLICLLAALVIALTSRVGKLEVRSDVLLDEMSALWGMALQPPEDEEVTEEDEEDQEEAPLNQDYGLAS